MRLGVRRWWNIHCCLLLSRRLLSSSHFFHFSAVASQPKIECFSALRPRRETKGLGEHVMELRDYNYHVEVIKGNKISIPILFSFIFDSIIPAAHNCPPMHPRASLFELLWQHSMKHWQTFQFAVSLSNFSAWLSCDQSCMENPSTKYMS